MVYSIKEHEVQRVAVILKSLGWEVTREVIGDRDITLTIHRDLPEDLLRAAGELEGGSPSR